EVARVALGPVGVGVAGAPHLVDALPGQLPVGGVGEHVEVDVAGAVLGRVGVAAVDQAAHQLHHLRDVPGGARLHRRRQAAQRVVGGGEGALVALGHRPPVHVLGAGDVEDLVVDIGDVAAERDL